MTSNESEDFVTSFGMKYHCMYTQCNHLPPRIFSINDLGHFRHIKAHVQIFYIIRPAFYTYQQRKLRRYLIYGHCSLGVFRDEMSLEAFSNSHALAICQTMRVCVLKLVIFEVVIELFAMAH